MKSALRLGGCLLSDCVHASPLKAQFKYLSYILSLTVALKLGLLPAGILFTKKNNKKAWSLDGTSKIFLESICCGIHIPCDDDEST